LDSSVYVACVVGHDDFPSPQELLGRLRGDLGIADDKEIQDFLFPFYRIRGMTPRYYQEIAINRAVQAVIQGNNRILICMATGTGKTFVAFQIIWKLWKTGRIKKVLYLADMNILADQAKDRTFFPFGDALHKIQRKAATHGYARSPLTCLTCYCLCPGNQSSSSTTNPKTTLAKPSGKCVHAP
jgi:type I site-specific restriction endonuclease